jgi:hypothetical protein
MGNAIHSGGDQNEAVVVVMRRGDIESHRRGDGPYGSYSTCSATTTTTTTHWSGHTIEKGLW